MIINRSNKNTSIKNKGLKTSNSELTILVTKTNSKIYKCGSFNEVFKNLIYNQYWKKTIKKKMQKLSKELQNLENHETWKYEELLLGKKVIGSK